MTLWHKVIIRPSCPLSGTASGSSRGHKSQAGDLTRKIREDQRNGKPFVLQTCCQDSV